MAATLQEILLTPENQPKVMADCYTLVEQEVSDNSGIRGTALKVAYKTVSAVAPGHVRYLMEAMLPQMVDQLEPFWADYAASGASGFGDYLAKRGDEVSEAMLSITDDAAQGSGRATIVKAYKAVRGSAAKNVTAALPAVGALVEKYAG
jgi:hypothetical protein